MSDTKIEDGGPAFPCDAQVEDNSGSHYEEHYGLTMRDWFAAHASEEDVQNFLPKTVDEVREFHKRTGGFPNRQWARYRHADAMLAARKEKV